MAHYEILDELGRGGMGIVYRARDINLDREVALKSPTPEHAADPNYHHRFLREARAASRLSHPHIVPIFEVFEHGGRPWLAMQLVEGRSLRALLDERGALPVSDVLRHAEGLAGALQAAHDRHVLHRDVKPGNVIMTPDGRALLADFSLARFFVPKGEESSATTHSGEESREGAMVGTPGYLSPEQALGKPVDPRSDIFSLGAVLYEMCTGRPAFFRSENGDSLDATLHREPVPISRLAYGVPDELERIIRKALAKRAEERYQSASDMAADLRALRRHFDHEKYGTERLSALHPRFRSRWLRAIESILGGALIVLLVAWLVSRVRDPGRPGFAERDWLLIADFENDSQAPVFDQTLREGLTVALQQSRYVNVLPRVRILEALRRMKRTDPTFIDEALGREICQREGIPVLLTGSIRRSGETFQMTIRALEPTSGNLLFAESVQLGNERDLFDRVDALARRVREDLGESLIHIEKSSLSLARATTGSLEALQLYSRAKDLMLKGDVNSASLLFQGAARADPNFAMAHLLLGQTYAVLGDPRKEQEHYTRAYGLLEGVTDRERYLIAAAYFKAQGLHDTAIANLNILVSVYPDDLDGHHQLALAYLEMDDVARAIAELRQVLRLDPFDAQAAGNLVLSLVRDNQAGEAIAIYQGAVERGVQSPYLHWGLGLARLSQGDEHKALAEFHRLEQAGGIYQALGQLYVARTLVYKGQLTEALEELDAGIRLDQRTSNKQYELLRRNLLARVFLLRGETDSARRQLQAVLAAVEPTLQSGALFDAGALYARMGDIVSARQVLTKLALVEEASPSRFSRSWSRSLAGEIALAEGRMAKAIEWFEAANTEYSEYTSHHGLARAYQAKQAWDRAVAEWRRVVDARGEILHHGFPEDWVLAHLELGRIYRHLDDERARKCYEDFLRIWRDADDSPVRDAALREWRELTGGAPPPALQSKDSG